MSAQLLEGKTLALQMQNEIREFVVQAPGRICLAVVETKKDPSAEWYMGAQERLAAKLGEVVGRHRIPLRGREAVVPERRVNDQLNKPDQDN